MSVPVGPPNERLGAGALGPVLERANREFEAGIDEPAAFERLAMRLAQPRVGTVPRVLVPVLLAALGALTFGLVFSPRLSSRKQPSIAAEPTRLAEPPRGESRANSVATLRPAPANALEASRASTVARDPSPRRATALPRAAESSAPERARALDAASVAPASSVAVDGPDCLSLARSGSVRAAEECFLKRAEGTGLGAEMALYEVSRLRRDVLADANGALEALASYRQRFPEGSLRREADVSQLELLMQLGQSEKALLLTQELLASSATGERGAELYLLRGHILRKNMGDCRAAERAYALSEEARGASRVEASYFRGICLEALGEREAARRAFERYLERGGRTHAGDTRRRLEVLAK